MEVRPGVQGLEKALVSRHRRDPLFTFDHLHCHLGWNGYGLVFIDVE